MAAQTWPEWLSGLLSRLWPRLPPRPGSHEARLEELRVHALLNKELRKPAGQRDEELVHKLRVETLKRGLENAKVSGGDGWWRPGCGSMLVGPCFIRCIAPNLHLPPCPLHMQATRLAYKCGVWSWDRTTRQCCGAAPWATQRIAASYRALADFYEQVTQQVGNWRRGSAGAAVVSARPASCLAGSSAQVAAQPAATPACQPAAQPAAAPACPALPRRRGRRTLPRQRLGGRLSLQSSQRCAWSCPRRCSRRRRG